MTVNRVWGNEGREEEGLARCLQHNERIYSGAVVNLVNWWEREYVQGLEMEGT